MTFQREKICTALFLFLAATPLSAAIQNVHITGTTNTQAILNYDAPDGNACQLVVSENANFTPLVNDVDATKFPNANLDNRPGNISNGTSRQFVIGKRTAEMAADHLRYSRALQALTTHYFQISCPSTGDTATGQFLTANIPMGQTHSDSQPADPSNPGEYAWPTLSMSDRTQKIVDPQTGALIRRVSLPQDRAYTQGASNQALNLARSSAWANPTASLTNDTQSATISANNTSTLFVSSENNGGFAGYFGVFHAGHQANFYTLDWYQLNVNASTSNGSCATNSTDDCKIIACLTINGVSCYAGSQQYEQSLKPSAQNYSFGTTGTPIDLWQAAGTRPPNGTEIATRQGTVTCNGSNAITQTGGDFFAAFWASGTDIVINGLDYQIANVTGLGNATLQTTCPAGTYNYAASNFGALIRKKTTSADTISVQYVNATYQLGIFPYWDYSGEYDLCSTATVVGPSGNPGYNCSTIQNGSMYWIDGVTGESHLIALNQGVYNTPTGACGAFDSSPFDATNPDIWYCGGSQPQRVQYFGNHSEPMNVAFPGHLEEGANLPTCNAATNPSNQPCLLFTSLTGSTNMGSLAAAFDSGFLADRFVNWYLAGVENGIIIFRNWRTAYGSIGWTVLFDPNARANGQPNNAGCVGNGVAGCVVGAVPSWSRPNARWCTLKANDFFGVPGWTAMGPYGWGGSGDTTPGVGPYVSTVNDGTALSNAVGVPGGLNACPLNQFGVTGLLCTTLKVDGEPRDPSPCTTSAIACGGAVETGLPGELGNAAPGDYFAVGNETVRLLAKTGTQWSFQRGFGAGGTITTTSSNPVLSVTCNSVQNPATAVQPTGEFFWNFAADPHGNNLTGNTITGDPYNISSHYFSQGGNLVNAYSFDPRCPGNGDGYSCYQVRPYVGVTDLVNSVPTVFVQQNPFFSGKYGPAGSNQVQQHPAGPGVFADSSAKPFFWDGRPFNGGSLSGSLGGDGSAPATAIGGQLWKFTTAQLPSLDRKFLPTFAFSGYKTLLDVSGPASTIGSGTADSFKYCVANAPGECVPTSTTGDVYVNAPFVNRPYCHYAGQAGQMPDEFDLCIGNNSLVYNSNMQVGATQTDNSGRTQRMISKALGRNRLLASFYHPHALPNGKWIIVDTNYAENIGDMVLAIKVPPAPAPDSVNRGDFVPVKININSGPSPQATAAFVEFGYAEWGASTAFRCTSRAEACAVGRSTNADQIDGANPFYFENTEAASLTGTPCASGCTVAIPGVSGRVIYGRVNYRNSTGSIIASGDPFAIAVP